MKKEFEEVEIIIDDNGDVFLTRDHEDLFLVAKALGCDQHIVNFFEKKPKSVDGDINYQSFCG